MRVLYDLTRLVANSSRSGPTGIDRVDLEYAKHFASNGAFFLIQSGPIFRRVEDKKALKFLADIERVWSGDRSRKADFLKPLMKAPKAKQEANSSALNGAIGKLAEISSGDLAHRKHIAANMVRNRKSKDGSYFGSDKILRIPFLEKLFFWALIHLPRLLLNFLKLASICTKPLRRPRNQQNTLSAKFEEESEVASIAKETYGQKLLYFNASHHIDSEAQFTWLMSVLPCKFAFFIHDAIPIQYPEFVRDGNYEVFETRLKIATKFTDLFVVNSNFTKKVLSEELDKRQMLRESLPIVVSHIGIDPQFRSDKKRVVSPALSKTLEFVGSEYFIVIGTIEPRKNHTLLLNLWKRSVEKGIDPPHLLIIGARGWNNEHITSVLDRSNYLKNIWEFNGLSDDELAFVLRHARALLFPSFVEGWGMPLVEAIAANVPVICSDIPVFHEAGQEMLEYIDPLDSEQWWDTILEYFQEDSSKRRDQIDRLQHYQFPTWSNHFGIVDTAIEELSTNP